MLTGDRALELRPLAQVRRTQPGAGRDKVPKDKRLSAIVAKHTQNVSFWPSEDDYEQMAATRLKHKTVAEAYEKGCTVDEVTALASKVSSPARQP